MRKCIGFCLLSLAISTTSAAQELPSEERWSVGGGVGFSGQEFGRVVAAELISSLSSLSSSSTTLAGVPRKTGPSIAVGMFAEGRLTPRVWLRFGASAAHDSYDYESSPTDDGPVEHSTRLEGRTTDFELSAGPLYWFNPGGAVEVGVFGALRAGYARFSSTRTESTSSGSPSMSFSSTRTMKLRGSGFALGGEVGLGFQRRLADHLYLRLTSTVAQSRYLDETATATSTSTTSGSGGSGTNPSSGTSSSASDFSIAAHFAPWLELRLAF